MARAKKTETNKAEAAQQVETPAKAHRTKKSSLKINIFDLSGQVVEDITLPEEIFGVKVNNPLLAQAVRVYLTNQHQGTRRAKTRGMVVGSTRKIRKQKGTGSARHGAITAPTFVSGGKAHGPVAHTRRLVLPNKMKKAALFSALSKQFANNNITVIANFEKLEPKTKKAALALSQLEVKPNTKVLCVLESADDNTTRALRNLPYVSLEQVKNLHTYEVLSASRILFAKDAIMKMVETLKEGSGKRQAESGKKETTLRLALSA